MRFRNPSGEFVPDEDPSLYEETAILPGGETYSGGAIYPVEYFRSPQNDKHGEMCCECGSINFHVRYIPYPFTGCFCEVECEWCHEKTVLMDDYS